MRRLLYWLTWPIRILLRLLWRFVVWLTWPIRALAARLIAFFNPPDPEEVSMTDALAHTLRNPADLLPHLEELRVRILWALISLAISTALSFLFARQLLEFLAEPIGGLGVLQAIEVTEPIAVYMRVSLLAGVTLAMPAILYQIYQFISPGLRRSERRMLLFIIPFATLLFGLGLTFTYYIMLPAAIPFLVQFGGIHTIPRPDNYFKFVTSLLFWIGLSFQMPLVIYALAAAGLVKARALAQYWRFAIVGIAILAAAVTPTVDPVNMGLVMLPMIGLYFLSILLAFIAQRGRERRRKPE
ncbi:MAG: twin-arginine translocase subunit TatC [Chloroflexi bacterium]|nr:twin-arginine translocase subunit TatC [Chloroflexota bacterium]MBI3762525.1 twin-arginine translocase subunit TatC [Chloroflexota bacterium]